MIENTNDDIIKDIKEKIKRNPKYTHPCNREFQEDIKKYGFKNGNKFISWMQQNGILKSPTDVDNEWARKRGYKNYVDYHNHLAREKGFVNLNDRRNHLAREKGFINLNDYKNHLTREKGFESLSDYYNHLAQKRGFKNQYDEFLSKRGFKDSKEYRDNLAQEKGFRDNKEYRDQLAQEQGYRNHSEYQKNLKWNRGCSPTFENKDCSAYLGIHIVEKKIAKITLEMIFEYIEIMPNNNPGFDFICKNAKNLSINIHNLDYKDVKNIKLI